jgi:hypothetical protein
MSTAITTSTAFQDRIFTRIRDQIGELMSDEELKGLVDASLQKLFFTERPITDQWNGRVTGHHPPPIYGLVQELLGGQVKAAAAEWLEAHPEDVKKIVDEAIRAGVTRIVMDYFDSKVANALQPLANAFYNMENALRNQGVNTSL